MLPFDGNNELQGHYCCNSFLFICYKCHDNTLWIPHHWGFYLVVLQGWQWVSSLLSFSSFSFLLTNMVVSSSKLIIISYFVYNVLQMWRQVLSLTLLCFSFLVVLLLWAQQALSSSSSILPSEKHFGSCSFIKVLNFFYEIQMTYDVQIRPSICHWKCCEK
jgi:hypothetical protein